MDNLLHFIHWGSFIKYFYERTERGAHQTKANSDRSIQYKCIYCFHFVNFCLSFLQLFCQMDNFLLNWNQAVWFSAVRAKFETSNRVFCQNTKFSIRTRFRHRLFRKITTSSWRNIFILLFSASIQKTFLIRSCNHGENQNLSLPVRQKQYCCRFAPLGKSNECTTCCCANSGKQDKLLFEL